MDYRVENKEPRESYNQQATKAKLDIQKVNNQKYDP